jgi:hypothetical protein
VSEIPYTPITYVNGTTPAINAIDLNKTSDELKLQANAVQPIVANSLPTWANGVAPAVSDAAPLNEMERVCQLVAQAVGLSYTPTSWASGWTPARNATRLNHLEAQVQANRAAIDAPAPTWTSSIADGATIATGTTWTVTVTPPPDSVEFWDTPSGQPATLLKTDTTSPYDVVLNVAGGAHILGVCAWHGAVRTCFSDRRNVTVTGAPPPPGDAYFVAEYSTGLFQYPPWTTLFSYATNPSPGGGAGFYDLSQSGPVVGTVDGRTRVVPNPSGSGNVVRVEIRDADPGWPNNTALQKSVARTVPQYTWNKSQAALGDIRWFSMSLYMPYNATEKFEWGRGGGNAFLDLIDLHPNSGTAWPAFSLQWYPETPQWAKFRVAGGPTINDTTYLTEYNLWQLTDSSGARVMANHNRWISLIWGMKFNPDNTGWLEVWVDGVNTLPRVNRPTMWGGDYAMYFQHGLYKQKNALCPETGGTILYFGNTTISLSRPF